MPHSHHSHSGEFCLHASDELEHIVQAAIRKGMKVLALTEHMPRDLPDDLYPEEVVDNLPCLSYATITYMLLACSLNPLASFFLMKWAFKSHLFTLYQC